MESKSYHQNEILLNRISELLKKTLALVEDVHFGKLLTKPVRHLYVSRNVSQPHKCLLPS